MRLCARCSRPFLAPGPSGFPGAGSLFCSKTCRLETWACLFAEMCPPPHNRCLLARDWEGEPRCLTPPPSPWLSL